MNWQFAPLDPQDCLKGRIFQYIPPLGIVLLQHFLKCQLVPPVSDKNDHSLKMVSWGPNGPAPPPCADIDTNIVPVTGARQVMSNNPLLLQKLPEVHKVVFCSPSPFHKNTHPLIYESLLDVGESRVWFASKNLTPCRMH